MKTFFIVVQNACGPRANPANHRSKLIVNAADDKRAEELALRVTGAVGVVMTIAVAPDSALRV